MYGYYKDSSGDFRGGWNGACGHDDGCGANLSPGVHPGLSEFLFGRDVVILVGRQIEYPWQ
jgi:hypothetical protein